MAIQKIQSSAKSTKGFTLVELIVVITILVILGTIAFLNLGSFSAGARDSQRTSDLNQINTQVMTVQAKNGLAYSAMLSGVTSLRLTGINVGGTGGIVNTDYFAGDVSYAVLGIDASKMDDPVSSVPYKMGATTKAGGAYELTASLEETKTALVMGTFLSRGTGSTQQGSGTVSGRTITLTSGAGVFKINDWIRQGTSGTGGQITAISGDLKTITINADGMLSGGAFQLILPDSAGLLGSGSTAITNKGTTLPY